MIIHRIFSLVKVIAGNSGGNESGNARARAY
jgi:hypothetical protein